MLEKAHSRVGARQKSLEKVSIIMRFRGSAARNVKRVKAAHTVHKPEVTKGAGTQEDSRNPGPSGCVMSSRSHHDADERVPREAKQSGGVARACRQRSDRDVTATERTVRLANGGCMVGHGGHSRR